MFKKDKKEQIEQARIVQELKDERDRIEALPFVTEKEYNSAVTILERAVLKGQLGNRGDIIGTGKRVRYIGDAGTMYFYAENYVHILTQLDFKLEQSIKDAERKKHEDSLTRLKDEISRKAKEMEEIGKKLGELK